MNQRKRTNKVTVERESGRFVEDVDRIVESDVSPSAILARAVALHLDGKQREALAELSRAVDSGTANADIYSARGHIQFELERYDDAAASYAKLAELAPDHASAAFNLAVCLEKLERWSQAAEQFERSLAKNPGRLEALAGLGICLLRMEKPEQALASFDKGLAQDPTHENLRFGKAVALQLVHREDEAAEIYEEILRSNARSEESLVNLISIGIARKDERATREYSEKLISIRNMAPAALEGLANCAFWSGDCEAAVQYCVKLVESNPDNYQWRFNLGVAYQRLNKLEQAAATYREAVRIKPDASNAHVNLGVVLHELGEEKGAVQAYEEALKLDPNLPNVRYNLALLLERAGSGFEAETYYEQLLADHPDSADAWFRLGYLRLQRSYFPGAVECFEKCLARRKPWPEAEINLGLAFWRSGDHDAAGTAFEAALQSDPESIEAMRGLAAISVERNDLTRALELQAGLIDRGERSPELFYNTGLLLQKTGNLDDAIRLYKEAVADKPDFPEALLNLGHALKEKGNPDEARIYWSQALAANPRLAQGYFDGAGTVQ